MKRLLSASVLALSFGCCQAPQEKPAAAPIAPAAQMIPVQRQVTRIDAQGHPYSATETVMVPVNGLPAAPAVMPEPIRAVPGVISVPGEKLYSPAMGEKLNAPPKQKQSE